MTDTDYAALIAEGRKWADDLEAAYPGISPGSRLMRQLADALAATQKAPDPNPEWEAIADAAHAANIAEHGVEPAATLNMLKRWKADAEPANHLGQVSFSRAMLDSATDALSHVLADRDSLREEVLRQSAEFDKGAAETAVCNAIRSIMETYREQEAEDNVRTPGGLEHMGDVWRLFHHWDDLLRSRTAAMRA